MNRRLVPIVLTVLALCGSGCAKQLPPSPSAVGGASSGAASTADGWQRRLEELSAPPPAGMGGAAGPAEGLRIGAEDLLEVTVFEVPELSGAVRVSALGTISLPLLGEVRAAGLTPRALELALEAQFRGRYLVDPHVGVQVKEIQSNPVSVLGAVRQPGVYQVRGARTLLEVLALAGGLAVDAGKGVVVMRAGARSGEGERGLPGAAPQPAATEEIELSQLVESDDPRTNIWIQPGDIVKVKRAGMVYVVGEVNRPGVFPLASREQLTVLQAVALGEGLLSTAAKGRALVIRTSETGDRVEIPVDLGNVLAGKAADPRLVSDDVVFVPSSATKTVARGLVDAMVRMVTFRTIF